MGHKPHRGLSGVLSSAGAGTLSLLAGLLLLPVVLSTVGPSAYGVWLVLSTLGVVLNYSDLGVGAAVVHFASRRRGGRGEHGLSELLSAALLWNALAGVIVIPAFAFFAYQYTSAQEAAGIVNRDEATVVVVSATFLLASLFVRPFGSALVGSGLLPLERRNATVGVLFRVLGTIGVCALMPTVAAVAVVETAAALLPAVLSAAAVRSRGLARLRWERSTVTVARLMLSYSIRSFTVSLVGALLLQGGTFVAGLLISPAAASYFNASFRVYSSVRQLVGWIIDPFRAALSRSSAENLDEAERLMLSLCGITVLSVSAGCGVLIFAAPTLVPVWLGSSAPVEQVIATLVILLLGLIANAVHLPFVPAADARGRPGVFLMPQILWLVVFASLVAPFSTIFGAPGIALALTVPLLVIEPLYIFIARRVLRLNLRDWGKGALLPVLKTSIPAAAAALTVQAGALAFYGLTVPGWLAAALFVSVFSFLALAINGWRPPPDLSTILRAKL